MYYDVFRYKMIYIKNYINTVKFEHGQVVASVNRFIRIISVYLSRNKKKFEYQNVSIYVIC